MTDGGPAFPTACDETPGMTLRDYFAANSMQQLVVAHLYNVSRVAGVSISGETQSLIASLAYEMADAMLKARGE